MTRRRQSQVKENDTIKKKKGKFKCFIVLLIMIFVYYQVVILFNYTFGNKVTTKSLKIYSLINEIIP